MATKVWSVKSGIIRASESSAVKVQRWMPSAGFAPEGRVVAEKKPSGSPQAMSATHPVSSPDTSSAMTPSIFSSTPISEPAPLTPDAEALVSVSALGLLPEELEHVRQQAFKEGEAEGRKLGFEEGKVAGKQAAEATFEERFAVALEPRVQAMQAPLVKILEGIEAEIPQLDGVIAEQIVDLALLIAQQMTCSAIKFNRKIILSIFDHAIHALPREARGLLQIYLHPDDAKILKEFLVHQLKADEHRVFIDSDIQRGGCRLVSRLGELDATLEDRWKTLIKNLGRDMSWLNLEGSQLNAPLELELRPEASTGVEKIDDTEVEESPSPAENAPVTKKAPKKTALSSLPEVEKTIADEPDSVAIPEVDSTPEAVKNTPAKKRSPKKVTKNG